MFETQLEIDFVAWLRELSKDVEVRYGRYFETNGGDCDDNDYCTECVQIERWRRKHAKSKFIKICGWDEAPTQDGCRHCDRCGCMLEFSPTEYCTEQYIEHIPECEELDDEFAWELWNWMSGMGSFDRDEHWPQIKPHAERLMRAAGRDIIQDGWIRYIPAENHWSPSDTIWFTIYQWFAWKLVLWIDQTGKGERGFLVDTSGRNVQRFEVMTKPEDAHRCVQQLLRHVGQDSERGHFLAELSLWSRRDLENEILIPDGRCSLPSFDVRGRVLAKPPSECLPDAVVVTHAELQLSNNAEEWSYRLYYSDRHWERTSWCVTFWQNDVPTLPGFCDAVKFWMDDLLVEVGPEYRFSMDRYREWDKVRSALKELLFFPCDGTDRLERMTDAFMESQGGSLTQHRVNVTPEIEETITGWLATKENK